MSPVVVARATERAVAANADIRFRCGDAFPLTLPPGRYDLVYDSARLQSPAFGVRSC